MVEKVEAEGTDRFKLRGECGACQPAFRIDCSKQYNKRLVSTV